MTGPPVQLVRTLNRDVSIGPHLAPTYDSTVWKVEQTIRVPGGVPRFPLNQLDDRTGVAWEAAAVLRPPDGRVGCANQ